MADAARQHLSNLRDELARLEAYPWSNVESWTAKATPIVRLNWPKDLDDFRRVTKTPPSCRPSLFSLRDGRDDPPTEATKSAAGKAKERILSFLDGLLAASRDIQVEILQTIDRLQGKGAQYVDDSAIAEALRLNVEELTGHLEILKEEGHVELAEDLQGCSAYLTPKQRLRLNELQAIDLRAFKAAERGEPFTEEDDTPVQERASGEGTLVDTYLKRIKNHPLSARLIIFGLIAGGLAAFAAAVKGLVDSVVWASQFHRAIIPLLLVVASLFYVLGPSKWLKSIRPASPLFRFSLLVFPLALLTFLFWGGTAVSPDATWKRVEIPPADNAFAPPFNLIEDILLGDEYPGGTLVREKVKAWREENDYEPPDVQWVAYQ